MASAVLGAGIFAAILKSFQFSGIFQKALANVIYNSEYLAKQDRPYVANLWGIATDALFTSRFPQIKQAISEPILNVYLPTDHNYHFENCIAKYLGIKIVRMQSLDENGKQKEFEYVEYTMTLSTEIVAGEGEKEIPIRTALTRMPDPNSVREIKKFFLYEDERLVKDCTSEIKKELEQKRETAKQNTKQKTNSVVAPGRTFDSDPGNTTTGEGEVISSASPIPIGTPEFETTSFKREYKISSKHCRYRIIKEEFRRSRLDLPENEQLAFETSMVTHGMTVDVDYDHEAIAISFINLTIKNFITLVDTRGFLSVKNSSIICRLRDIR